MPDWPEINLEGLIAEFAAVYVTSQPNSHRIAIRGIAVITRLIASLAAGVPTIDTPIAIEGTGLGVVVATDTAAIAQAVLICMMNIGTGGPVAIALCRCVAPVLGRRYLDKYRESVSV